MKFGIGVFLLKVVEQTWVLVKIAVTAMLYLRV